MSTIDEIILEENDCYCLTWNESKHVLMFSWKYIEGLSTDYFQTGIVEFAVKCKEHKASYAVIDASALDQNSPAIDWLQGRISNAENDDYNTWWLREIVPIYHDSGIARLAVGTGDVNAPGELRNVPAGVKFKIGYFADVEAALLWSGG